MPYYKLYVGLGGGFGGATYQQTIECKDEQTALDWAYEDACQEYESYAGLHGLRDIDDIIEEDGVDEDGACEIYEEEREGWLDYWVEETDSLEEEEE